MADYTFHVDTQQLRTAANQFDQCCTKCANYVKTMMRTCTGLQGKWTGPAATTYYNKLTNIQGDLNDLQRIIQEHSKDLRDAAARYESANTTAQGNVTNLNTDVLTF